MLISCSLAVVKPPQRQTTTESLPAKGDIANDATMPWRLSTRREARLFVSDSGVRAELAPVDSTTDPSLTNYYLLRMSGQMGELAGATLLTWYVDSDGFYTSLYGGPRRAIGQTVAGTSASIADSTWTTVGLVEPFEHILLRAGDASEVDGADLVRRYREDLDSGFLQRVAPLDRKSRELLQAKILKDKLAAKTPACDAVEFSIDWASVKDEWFDSFSIAGACLKHMSPVESFCSQFPHRLDELRAGGPVVCSFSSGLSEGPDSSVERAPSGVLRFVVGRPLKMGHRTTMMALRTIFGESDVVLRGKDLYFVVRSKNASAVYQAEPKWIREPYFLGRDTKGTYYYVDRVERAYGGKRHQVFVGRRGQLKLTKLKGVVDDSEGTLFSTTRGDLRLLVSNSEPKGLWIKGKNKKELTNVFVGGNLELVYDELGVYFGEDMGFVCEK